MVEFARLTLKNCMNLSSSFQAKSVLITGGAGFIGSTLAHRLVNLGANVTLLDSLSPDYGGNLFNLRSIENNITLIQDDARNAPLVARLVQNQHYIFNLAARVSHTQGMRNPQEDLSVNAAAALTLLEACRQHNPEAKIVYTSTRQIYGRVQHLPVDETQPIAPIDYNGITKYAAELYNNVARRVYGLHTVNLRLTNVYGARMRARDRRQNFLGWWIRTLLEGHPLQIYGDGTQLRDFNFVEDVVDALLLCAAHLAADGQTFNLGAAQPTTLRDLAQLLIQIHGRGEYQCVPFPPYCKRIEIGNYHGNFNKIQQTLGWQPRTTLPDGLRRTLDYYYQHHAYYW